MKTKLNHDQLEAILKQKISAYCLNTIFQKLHFSKSHFCETLHEKYDHVIFLQPKSRKKCCKNLKIGSLVK